jgi:molecular chaperone IbpA
MTNLATGRIKFGSLESSTILGTSLGYDSLFADIDRLLNRSTQPSEKYPPHNIIKLDDYNYVVELAIAGFSKDDIDITVADGSLIVKGEKKQTEEESSFLDNVDYLHKGISARAFTKSISIVDTVEVLGAEYVDGILRIRLENVIPESKKPRKIIIANGNLPLVEPTKTEKQLLVEN